MKKRITKQSVLFVFLMVSISIYSQNDSINPKNNKENNQFSTVSVPKHIGWVNDFEMLYTKKQINTIDSIIRIYKSKTTIEIALITIDTTMTTKANFEEYTLKVANSWGLGLKDKNNGILIAISKGLRSIRIHNGYGIEKIISDSETKEIIDEHIIPYFKNGDFYAGTLTGLTKLIELIELKQ